MVVFILFIVVGMSPTAAFADAVATASPSLSSSATICAPYVIRYHQRGDRGMEVVKLQQFLNRYDGENITVTGYYGPHTEAAVKRFQRKYGIAPVSGKQLGETTLHINLLHCGFGSQNMGFMPVAKPAPHTSCPAYLSAYGGIGKRGVDVSRLQLFLNVYYDAQLPVTGFYGSLTKAAVKKFQESYGIVPSGNQLAHTTAVINGLYCLFGGRAPIAHPLPVLVSASTTTSVIMRRMPAISSAASSSDTNIQNTRGTRILAQGALVRGAHKLGAMAAGMIAVHNSRLNTMSVEPTPVQSAVLYLLILIIGIALLRFLWAAFTRQSGITSQKLPLTLPPAPATQTHLQDMRKDTSRESTAV